MQDYTALGKHALFVVNFINLRGFDIIYNIPVAIGTPTLLPPPPLATPYVFHTFSIRGLSIHVTKRLWE